MNSLKALVVYSLMMVTLPIVAFFFSKSFVENFFGVLSSNSYIYATVVSVVVVHLVLGGFVYEAYNEKPIKPEYAESKTD